MNYYQHHIGDFDRATRHLTRIERSIYRDLMDVYYDTEAPLTLDIRALCRKIIARTSEEITAVEQVLNEFFTKTPVGWYHDRCEEELDHFRASTSQKSAAGKASAAKRAEKRQQAIKGSSTPVEQPLDERSTEGQLTNNQEPETNHQEPEKHTAAADAARPTSPDLPVAIEKRKPTNDPEASKARRDVGDAVRTVFVYWQQAMNHTRTILDSKRETAIRRSLKAGYSVEELCAAVDGCKLSPYHMGQNPERVLHDDIELICRNSVNVDKFKRLAERQNHAPGRSASSQQTIDNLTAYLQEQGA